MYANAVYSKLGNSSVKFQLAIFKQVGQFKARRDLYIFISPSRPYMYVILLT